MSHEFILFKEIHKLSSSLAPISYMCGLLFTLKKKKKKKKKKKRCCVLVRSVWFPYKSELE